MDKLPAGGPQNPSFPRSPTMICTVFSVAAIGLGLVVMIGWKVKSPGLIQVFPGLVPMQFNTALGISLSGLALLFTCRKFLAAGKALGIVVAFLGLLTLVQYLTHTNFGIDEWFMDHYITTKTAFSGRMAPNTALCFFLGGLAVTLANHQSQRHLVFPIGTLVAGLGLLAFIGYATNLETAYGWGHLTRMAIHTSLAFVILGLGMAAWGLNLLDGSSPLFQHWKVLAVSVFLMVIAFSQWQVLKDKEENEIQKEVSIQLSNYIEDLEIKNENQFSTLMRLTRRWGAKEAIPLDLLEADARLLFKDLKDLAAIAYLDPSYKSYWIADSLEEPLIGDPNSGAHGFLSIGVLKSLPHANTFVTRGMTYPNGSHDILTSIPILFDDTFNGFILSVCSLEDLLTLQIRKTAFENFNIRVFDGSQLLWGKEDPIPFAEKGYIASKTLSLKNLKLQITFTPTPQFLKEFRSWLPNAILFAGLFSITAMAFLFILRKKNLQQLGLLNQEIQKRVSTEKSLQTSNAKLQLILDSAQEGILWVDSGDRIVFANKMAGDLLKFSPEDLRGCSLQSLFAEANDPPDTAISLELENQVPQPKETIFQKSDGTKFPVHFSKSATPNSHGVAKGAAITFQDISDRKTYERAILRHARDLERSNKALDEFAYIASHDLKAPLRGIMQLSKWIKEDVYDQLSAKTKKFFDLMDNRVDRMERLLSDLLNYARVGNKHGQFKKVDVAAMGKELFDLVAPSNGFRLDFSDPIPTLTTLSIPFEQVFRNLINNAIKHHDRQEGRITISCNVLNGGYEFCVADDGPGIPAQHHEKIFQLFQTLKPKDVVEGSGMGLSLVQKIIESYESKISIHSDGSRGTKVCFTWPDEETLRNLINA